MKPKIFIDGEAGTTGLQIKTRLEGRADLDFIRLSDADRKDSGKRAEALNQCDLAILCLPDDAAREAVALVRHPRVRVLDASSAHRVKPEWVYGLAEMSAEPHRRGALGDEPRLLSDRRDSAAPAVAAAGFTRAGLPRQRAGGFRLHRRRQEPHRSIREQKQSQADALYRVRAEAGTQARRGDARAQRARPSSDFHAELRQVSPRHRVADSAAAVDARQ